MNANRILYDLAIGGIGITLWLTPNDLSRAFGYSLSLLFSGRAYISGIILIADERKNDEKEGIQYEASLDFYERLLESEINSQLELKLTELETKTLQKLIPLLNVKRKLEERIHQTIEVQPDEQPDAELIEIDSKPTDESIREIFPEHMDATYWKAILSALQQGIEKEEIIKSVLECPKGKLEIGRGYLDYLKRKFL